MKQGGTVKLGNKEQIGIKEPINCDQFAIYFMRIGNFGIKEQF